MIGGRQSRGGEIIPGFDCSTGRAVGYNWATWKVLCTDLDLQYFPKYIRALDAAGVAVFEIFTKDKLR